MDRWMAIYGLPIPAQRAAMKAAPTDVDAYWMQWIVLVLYLCAVGCMGRWMAMYGQPIPTPRAAMKAAQ